MIGVNDVKLKNYLAADSPLNQLQKMKRVKSLVLTSVLLVQLIFLKMFVSLQTVRFKTVANAVVGANEDGYHLTGVNLERDFKAEYVDIRKVKEGEISPDGQGVLQFARGIEIGHIFKLGTRYSESMGANVLDENGRAVQLSWDVTVSV